MFEDIAHGELLYDLFDGRLPCHDLSQVVGCDQLRLACLIGILGQRVVARFYRVVHQLQRVARHVVDQLCTTLRQPLVHLLQRVQLTFIHLIFLLELLEIDILIHMVGRTRQQLPIDRVFG